MKNSYKLYAILSLSSLILLGGCSKSGTSTSQQEAGQANPSAQVATDQKATVDSALPKANADTPLDQYVKLKDGKQLMFMYLALSNPPVDYEKVAKAYSREYASSNDAFKKKDILATLKPRIDNEIANAKNGRYFYIEDTTSLRSYDFDKKAFEVDNTMMQDPLIVPYGIPGSPAYKDQLKNKQKDNTSFFDDNYFARFGYSNHKEYSFLKVTDEAKARQIETLSKKGPYPPFTLVIYAFAQGVDANNNYVQAQIVKIKLLDMKGNELLTQ